MRVLPRLLVFLVLASIFVAGSAIAMARPVRQIFTANHGVADDIDLTPLCARSLVKAADGTVLASLKTEQNRSPVTLRQVPDHVVDAILAVEDRAFFEHAGMNFKATVRALAANVDEGAVAQGGSTITQQLVKQSLVGSKRDFDRKIREAFLAVRLEEQMSKRQILERYLNTVYFGNSAYGLQAAGETYFAVGVKDLNIAQAALLAGLIRNPRAYDPFLHPDRALERRTTALRQMVAYGKITEDEATWYGAYPMPKAPHNFLPPANSYFVEDVKQDLLDDPRIGDTPAERFNTIFCGGITIETTLDPRAQSLAVAARNDVISRFGNPKLPGTFPLPADPVTGKERFGTVAMVSVEPSSGAVRAMVGGPGFKAYKYNLATQAARQGGSSFKTFVLTTLMQQGYLPTDSVNGGGPCRFNIPGLPEPYEVENFANSGGGSGSILSQTLRSSNCAYVRLGQIAGLENVARTANRMGITTPLDPNIMSMPLGSLEVRPIDMAAAYSVIFNDGVRNPAYLVERVLDRRGQPIFTHRREPEQVISVQAAREVQEVLRQNVLGGTGTAARIPGWDVGGKTGTAQDFGDAWFVGSTKRLTTAVWMGSPVGRVEMRNVGGRSVTGGSWPAAIWAAYMIPWHEGLAPVPFILPEKGDRGSRYLRVDPKIDRSGGGYTSSGTYRRRSTSGTTTTTTKKGPKSTSTTDTTVKDTGPSTTQGAT